MPSLLDELKSIRGAIECGDYNTAFTLLKALDEDDAKDYRARLLYATACLKTGDIERALKEFDSLRSKRPKDVSVLKGFATALFEAKRREQFMQILTRLLKILGSSGSQSDAIAVFTKFRKQAKEDVQLRIEFLWQELPDSEIYQFIKPAASPVGMLCGTLVNLERETLKQKLNQLKSRAKMNIQFTPDIFAHESLILYRSSRLGRALKEAAVYAKTPLHRRNFKTELLRYYFDLLSLLPMKEKPEIRLEILKLCEELVDLQSNDSLPYSVLWDWSDKELGDYDAAEFRLFCMLQPEAGLARVLDGYLHSQLVPHNHRAESQTIDEVSNLETSSKVWSQQDLINIFDAGFELCRDVVLVYRIISDFNLQSGDYSRAAQLAQAGLCLLDEKLRGEGTGLPVARRHLKVILGTSYIHYERPKNFEAAAELLDEVIRHDPDNIRALTSKGILLLEQSDIEGALVVLEKAIELDPLDPIRIGELAWCRVKIGELEEGEMGLRQALALFTDGFQLAQAYWRLGYIEWLRKNYTGAFDMFVSSLEQNPSYAPAYTYLGLFYDQMKDKSRAMKCFYKALELSNDEIIAGKWLASIFAEQGQWDLVEVVTSRVISGIGYKLGTAEAAWPYRTMGIACLQKRDWAGTVKYLQQSLRLMPDDVDSWIGLGETYAETGRYKSAEKTLRKALDLDPNNFSALYMMSLVKRLNLEYTESAEYIEKAVKLKPQSAALIAASIDFGVKAAQYCLQIGRTTDATDAAIKYGHRAVEELRIRPTHTSIWSALARVVEVLRASRHYEKIEQILTILENLLDLKSDAKISQRLSMLQIAICERALETASEARAARAICHFDLARAYHSVSLTDSILNLQQAIRLEPRNSLFWSTYGIVLAPLNARVAQHCFIRSLSINGRDSLSWAHLGLLYVMYNDVELAHDSFDRALSIDTECSEAWLGKALLKYGFEGATKSAVQLFEQAYLMSSSTHSASRLLFGLTAYHHTRKCMKGCINNVAMLALHQYIATSTNPEPIKALSYLAERAGAYTYARDIMFNRSVILYEDPKPENSDLDETAANVPDNSIRLLDLARIDIACNRPAYALANLNKISDDVPTTIYEDLGLLVVAGLAACRQGNAYSAVNNYLKPALELVESGVLEEEETEKATSGLSVITIRNQLIVLWAQALWMELSVEALPEIFERLSLLSAGKEPTILLAVLGLLGGDVDLMDACRDDLNNYLAMETNVSVDLCEVISRLENNKSSFYRALYREPSRFDLWERLDPCMALNVEENNCRKLTKCYSQSNDIAAIRRGIFYVPGNADVWNTFKRISVESSKG